MRQGYLQGFKGRTHHIDGMYDSEKAPRSGVHRGLEIEHWILFHVPPEQWGDLRLAIIDDESDMGRLLPWRVKTDTETGLKLAHLSAIQEALGRPVGDLIAQPNPLWTEVTRDRFYPGMVSP